MDRHCHAVWWRSWTADGAIQLKRTQTANVYTLRARDIAGDLSGADVYLGKDKIYSADITEYDPVRLRMVLRITDFKSRKLITETFSGGDRSAGAPQRSLGVECAELPGRAGHEEEK